MPSPLDEEKDASNEAVETEKVDVAQTDNSEQEKPAESKPIPFKLYIVLLISCFGVFMASVSTTALVIAFPVLLADLNMSIETMMWNLLVVLLALSTIVPTAGKLGDILGQSRVYIAGYWLFIVGSLGAGFVKKANQGYDLLAARTVIGVGAALLFTNSSAILTTAFAPYRKVGFAQGVFQIFSALGIVLGPLIGGGLATTNWRWIFWFNVPPGGILAILALVVVPELGYPPDGSARDRFMKFDYLGSFTLAAGLVLLLIALLQVVVTDAVLSKTRAVLGLALSGGACVVVFAVDQFKTKDPLIPPRIFYNKVFSTTTFMGTCMAFVRNSITYNMIFYLQGPQGQNPLQAGISLIPYGIGVMFSGFLAGSAADKLGVKVMTMIGPLVTLAACACLSVMDQHTSHAYIGGILFLAGIGIGLFQSPNSAANMLSVPPDLRGVAAAVSILCMGLMMMIGIVLTFSLVLHSMTAQQLFYLFVYGADATHTIPIHKVLLAIADDYYVVMAMCALASLAAAFLPSNLQELLKHHVGQQSYRAQENHLEMATQSKSKIDDLEAGGLQLPETSPDETVSDSYMIGGVYDEKANNLQE